MNLRSDIVKKERFYERLLADVTWRNEMWAIPRRTDVRVFYWNKALYEEAGLDPERPPTTWTELEAHADQLTQRDADGRLDTLGFSPIAGNPPGALQFWIYLWQLGGVFLSEDQNTAIFNSPEGVQALEWMVYMTDKYGTYDEINEFVQAPGVAVGQDVLSLGHLGTQVNGHWMIGRYDQYIPDLEYDVTAIPIPEGGQPANYIGGFTFVVPKGTQHPEASWRWIEFNMKDENQLLMCLDTGSIPAYEDLAFTDTWLAGDPRREVLANEVKVGRWVPVTPGAGEMIVAMFTILDEAMHHLKTPTEALDDGAAAVQAILDTNRPLREGV